MTEFTRVRTVPSRRGPVSRFNDETMEYLIALARLASLLATVATLGSLVGLIWTADGRWAATAAVTLAVGLATGWFGFKTNANEEWRSGGTTD